MAVPNVESVVSASKKKWGKLPVWGWGVIVGIAILIGYYYYSNHKKATAAGAQAANISTDSLAGTPAGGGGSGSSDTASIETNTSWRQKAVTLLVGKGVPPLDAQTALDNYLQGNTLTPIQAGYVNQAITALGLPPDGTLGIPSISNPTTATTPPLTPQPYKTTTPPLKFETMPAHATIYSSGAGSAAPAVSAAAAQIPLAISPLGATIANRDIQGSSGGSGGLGGVDLGGGGGGGRGTAVAAKLPTPPNVSHPAPIAKGKAKVVHHKPKPAPSKVIPAHHGTPGKRAV